MEKHSGIPVEDLGAGPGIGHSALRMVIVAIGVAIVMPWVSYRAMNFQSMTRTPVTPTAASAAVSSANVVGDAASAVKDTAGVALGAKSTVRLPNGAEVTAPPKGAEAALLNFLTNSPASSAETSATSTPMELDRVSFEQGSAMLAPSSDEQLKNIATILKAYPASSVQIQGYADPSQNAPAAGKLSAERAQKIKQELTALGVAPSQMSAAGSQQRGNPSPTTQGTNSEVELVVTKK
jgi:OmpA-OmpF porin, OOP family